MKILQKKHEPRLANKRRKFHVKNQMQGCYAVEAVIVVVVFVVVVVVEAVV